MPKFKTRKGMADRIRVTRNGKLIRRRAWKNHMLEKKSARRKRTYEVSQEVSAADRTEVRRALGV